MAKRKKVTRHGGYRVRSHGPGAVGISRSELNRGFTGVVSGENGNTVWWDDGNRRDISQHDRQVTVTEVAEMLLIDVQTIRNVKSEHKDRAWPDPVVPARGRKAARYRLDDWLPLVKEFWPDEFAAHRSQFR